MSSKEPKTKSQEPWPAHLSSRLAAWRAEGLSRQLKLCEGAGIRFKLNGKDVLSFASNDYLDLATHPELIAAAKAALDASGAGASASPLIVGHKRVHAQLEAALTAFKQTEAALVFPSGFQAALATLGALAGEDDSIIVDRLAHACLIDGAKLSGARVRAFKHNDVEDLKALLASEAPRRCIVVVESLYSMDGDLAPLREIVEVTREAGALLLVDEAHATGVLGARGRGALEGIAGFSVAPAGALESGGSDSHGLRRGLPVCRRSAATNGERLGLGDGVALARGDCGEPRIQNPKSKIQNHIIAMGTLSKALGSQGGFVCATQTIIDTIVHAGRAYLFSTALAPASAAAALAALKLVDAEPARRTHLMQISNSLRAALGRLKLNVVPGNGPIIPILTGAERRATAWSVELLKRGIFVPAIRYPTVKKGQARLRVSLSAAHTREDCQRLIDALKSLREKDDA